MLSVTHLDLNKAKRIRIAVRGFELYHIIYPKEYRKVVVSNAGVTVWLEERNKESGEAKLKAVGFIPMHSIDEIIVEYEKIGDVKEIYEKEGGEG